MKRSVVQMMAMLLALLAFQGCNKTKDNTPTPATPAPTITVFAPVAGVAGTVVTITGTNFGGTTDNNVVTFAGTPATVTAATASQLTVTVPQGAATGKISLNVGSNSVSSAIDFTVFGSPTITSFTPASALPGASVVITGTNFDATAANNVVKFNGLAATVTAATTTQLTVTVPAAVTNGKITVTTNGMTAPSATDFTLPPPTITSFSPASGLIGATVVITGTNYSTTLANNVVKFNGTAATVTAATATQLTVTVPVGTTNGKITVTANGATAISAIDFTVLLPTITSFTPANAAIGATVIITGTNFDTTPANNVVKFNGTVTTVTQATATQLTVTVPVGASSGKISVGSVLSAVDFTVLTIVPSVLSGAIGKAITITGSFSFDAIPANNVVKFNTTNAVVTAATATQLTVEVPYGATGGKISVAVNGATAVNSSTDFMIVSAWTQKTDCPTNFLYATSFVIGNKAYLGAGQSGASATKETAFYEFDPTGPGTWTVKQSTPALPYLEMSGFAIADKGYSIDINSGDIYKYIPGTNTWTNFINSGQSYNNTGIEITFALGSKGYIKDEVGSLIEFDPAANNGNGSVTPVQAYPLGKSVYQSAFVIGNVAYMGGGFDRNNGNVATNKFYKYTNGVWTAIANLPATAGFLSAFSIGQYGYVIQNGSVWRYNPAADSWTQLENFPYNGASMRPAFSIGQKGYMATGGTDNNIFHPTVVTWEYDPSK